MKKFKYNFTKMRPRADLYQVYKTAGIDFQKMPEIADIQQVFANERTIAAMEKTLRRGVMRKYRWMSDRKINSEVAFAMLGYAPVCDNSVPDNEIWVFNKEEAAAALDNWRNRKDDHQKFD